MLQWSDTDQCMVRTEFGHDWRLPLDVSFPWQLHVLPGIPRMAGLIREIKTTTLSAD